MERKLKRKCSEDVNTIKRVRLTKTRKEVSAGEKQYKANLVRSFCESYEAIHKKYYGKPKFILRMELWKNLEHKYSKIILKIAQYLLEERGNRANPIEMVMEDYISAIYAYFARFKRIPNVFQLSPTAGNQIHFNEFIDDWETRMEPEKYWQHGDPISYDHLKQQARADAKRAQSAVGRTPQIVLPFDCIKEMK